MPLNSDFKKYMLCIPIMLLHSNIYAGDAYEITRNTINNGGNISFGGTFELKASIGQNIISNESTGSDYSVTAGFWSAEVTSDVIFINDFES